MHTIISRTVLEMTFLNSALLYVLAPLAAVLAYFHQSAVWEEAGWYLAVRKEVPEPYLREKVH